MWNKITKIHRKQEENVLNTLSFVVKEEKTTNEGNEIQRNLLINEYENL
jgi:hypothetical protein